MTYFCQATVSVLLDGRFERGMYRSLFWVVWFPLIFWLLQAYTAVVGLPKAIFRRGAQGTWISPDRGITSRFSSSCGCLSGVSRADELCVASEITSSRLS